MTKKTVVLGATTNSYRYAYLAAHKLKESGHELIPIGIRKGQLAGEEILDLRTHPEIKDVHTITVYIGPRNMEQWIDYVLFLHPDRIIFNPGAENQELKMKAKTKGIETIEACTLVLLSTGEY